MKEGKMINLLRMFIVVLILITVTSCQSHGRYPLRIEVTNDMPDPKGNCSAGLSVKINDIKTGDLLIDSPLVNDGDTWSYTTQTRISSPSTVLIEVTCDEKDGTSGSIRAEGSIGLPLKAAPELVVIVYASSEEGNENCWPDAGSKLISSTPPLPCIET